MFNKVTPPTVVGEWTPGERVDRGVGGRGQIQGEWLEDSWPWLGLEGEQKR